MKRVRLHLNDRRKKEDIADCHSCAISGQRRRLKSAPSTRNTMTNRNPTMTHSAPSMAFNADAEYRGIAQITRCPM